MRPPAPSFCVLGDISNVVGEIGERAVELWLEARSYPFMKGGICPRTWLRDGVYIGRGFNRLQRELSEEDRKEVTATMEGMIEATEAFLTRDERKRFDDLIRKVEEREIKDAKKLGRSPRLAEWIKTSQEEGRPIRILPAILVVPHPPTYGVDFIARMPDLTFLEVKANMGRLNQSQAEFLELASDRGFRTALARIVVPPSFMPLAKEFLGGHLTLTGSGLSVSLVDLATLRTVTE